MVKVMKTVTVYSLAALVIFTAIYLISDMRIFFSLAIAAGTTAFHFGIRLIIGIGIDRKYNNKFDYRKKWFQPRKFENELYEILKVKKWKGFMPTADPEAFKIVEGGYEKLAQVTCQSEIIHEINMLASFLPLFASLLVGDFWVFFITSLLGAVYDLLFVIMQRFNRPRILRIAERHKK